LAHDARRQNFREEKMNLIERLGMEWELKRLNDDYVCYADQQDFDKFVTLFTDDAVLEIGGIERKGHAAIKKHFSDRPQMVTRHICTNLRYEPLDSNTATGEVYLTVYRAAGNHTEADGPVPYDRPDWIGEYRDRYVRTGDGWKFKERRLHVRFEKVK
jgi:ketosteroid isomerase-like protein